MRSTVPHDLRARRDAPAPTPSAGRRPDPITRRAKDTTALSFVFSTFNGAATLPGVLEGYADQYEDDSDWRLVIIDNASTDDTAAIIGSFEDRLPIVRFHCPQPGKNRALNFALASLAAHSRLCVFTDDDAVPHPGFVRAWERIAASPDCGRRIYGGTVVPVFPATPPDHVMDFSKRFPELYAQNSGKSDFEARDIYGPNMAVPGFVFERGARFDEDIGPNSGDGRYPMGSETEFCTRIAARFDLAATFVAQAAVDHVVRETQTTLAFISARAFRHGRGYALQLRLQRGRLYVLRQIAGLARLNSDPDLSEADRLWNREWRKGFLSEALRIW